MKTIAIIAGALFVLILGMIVHLNKAHAQEAAGQITCAPLQPLLDAMVKRYGENIIMTGMMGDKRVIVTISPKGTFSVLLSDGKKACIILAGEKAELDNGI